ncbi:hypothetical protein ACC696_37705, partial [Rhizobium ruizarguesonis]
LAIAHSALESRADLVAAQHAFFDTDHAIARNDAGKSTLEALLRGIDIALDGLVEAALLTSNWRRDDRKGNMDMTGTFMQAYGLNRLFAELPLIG